MKWYKSGEIRKKYSITTQTLYNWRNEKKIVFKKMDSGSYRYRDLEETQESSSMNEKIDIILKKIEKIEESLRK